MAENTFGSIQEYGTAPNDESSLDVRKRASQNIQPPSEAPSAFGAIEEYGTAPHDVSSLDVRKKNPVIPQSEEDSENSENEGNKEIEQVPRFGMENLLRSKAVTSISEKLLQHSQLDVLAGTSPVATHSQEKAEGDLVEGYKLTVEVNGKKVEIFAAGRSQGEKDVSQDANSLGLGELKNGQNFLVMVNTDGVTNGAFGQFAARLLGESAVKIAEQESWDDMNAVVERIQSGINDISANVGKKVREFLESGYSFTKAEIVSIQKGILAANGDLDADVAKSVLENFDIHKNSPLGEKVVNAIVSFSMVGLVLHNPSSGETHLLKSGDTTVSLDGQEYQGNSSGVSLGQQISLAHTRIDGVKQGILHSDFTEKDQHSGEAQSLQNVVAETVDMSDGMKQIISALESSEQASDDATVIMFRQV